MNSHKHARLTPKGRALLVGRVLDEGWSVGAASAAAGVSTRTGFKWLARFRSEGPAGLADRSSRPLRSPRSLAVQEQLELEGMRRMRWPLWRIAERSGRDGSRRRRQRDVQRHNPTGMHVDGSDRRLVDQHHFRRER